jgi:diguanylate cyclase (GGDEF)-like protein/PAS domain S-box-containing protein
MKTSLENTVLKASVEHIYSNSRMSVLSSFGIFLFIVFLLFDKVAINIIILGTLFHLSFLLYKIYKVQRYNKTKDMYDGVEVDNYWLNTYRNNTFLMGMGWGLLFFFLNNISLEYQLVVYIAIVGLAVAGLHTLGAVLSVYLAFILPIFGISIVWLLIQGDTIYLILATLVAVWCVYSYVMARGYSQNFRNVIIEREKNRIYTQELEDKNKDLKELEERMELALIGNNDGLWDWNLNDNSVFLSTRWKEMLGFDGNRAFSKFTNWEERIHPDDIARVAADIQDNIDRKTEFYENVHRLKHKDGHWVWILDRGKTYYDEMGKPVRMIGTHTDITQEKEMQLKYAHQAQIIEQVHDSIVSITIYGIITSWNTGSELLLGYKAHEMMGKHIFSIYPEKEHSILKKGMDVAKNNKKFSTEIHLVKKSNKVIPVELTLTLLKDVKGKAVGMICYAQDITERKIAQAKLRHQAHYDSLTGLPNRVLLNDRLRHGIEKAKRRGMNLALLFIDLDKFKHINDTLGHNIGDLVLKAVADRLKIQLRKGDTLARLGGDEFIIIMEDLEKEKDASLLAQKILEVLKDPVYVENNTLYVSSSIGISTFPNDSVEPNDLMKYADVAMYKAKEEGRNNFQYYSHEMTELVFERVMMESSLRDAIKNNEFITYYQPQVDARQNKIIGVEALVRWNHPSLGLIFPSRFMSFAEENGLILDIDQYVMQSSMKQVKQWYDEGLNPGVLALNLTVKQLEKDDFLEMLQDSLKKYEFKPEWLELEITESEIMKKYESSIVKLKEVSKLGIRVAIDDFGTEYSSLLYLKKLPVDKLKIDHTFINDIPGNEEDNAIVKAIIALAKSLNLDMIAEGVETDAQRAFVLDNGCDNIQGYYYSRAISCDDMHKFLLEDIKPSSMQRKISLLTRASKLYTREELINIPSMVPQESGYYVCFFKNLPQTVPLQGCTKRDGFAMVFLSSVPSKDGASSNLRKSVVNQYLKGNAHDSTLRLSLACLLKEELGISLAQHGSRIYLGDDEEVLNEWLNKNARISFIADDKPWVDKAEMIKELNLPLNIEHNQLHPFYATLKKLRLDIKKSIKENS